MYTFQNKVNFMCVLLKITRLWRIFSKLVRNLFNYCVLGQPSIFFQILSMHLLPNMNVMLHIICMGSAAPPGAHRKRQNTKWKLLGHSGIKTHNLQICIAMIYQLSSPVFDVSCPIRFTLNIHEHVLPIPMYTLI